MRRRTAYGAVPAILLLLSLFSATLFSQDWFRTGTGLGVPAFRLAVPDFPARTADAAALAKVFNDTLWNDLTMAGNLELVSKSFYPTKTPTTPNELDYNAWSQPPASAHMVAFGAVGIEAGRLIVDGWLYDVRNPQAPAVLGKRYRDDPTEAAARHIAHLFADEIVAKLGAGVHGVALSKIAFISNRTGAKEVWMMDYDGYNQHAVTNYHSLALTPRLSPDGARIAFTSYASGSPHIYIHSLDTNRRLNFRNYAGLNTTPAWSPDGTKLAFCSSMTGDPEIYVVDVGGGNLKRLTHTPGVDISPAWNPKTGTQIAFVSDRSGGPQIYLMEADGSNVRRLVSGGGQAVEPSWSPNGQMIAFSWQKEGGTNYDIYVMDVATGQTVQLTHDTGRNVQPSWSPNGRQIVFQSNRSGSDQIWVMMADGSDQRQVTTQGSNTAPNWGPESGFSVP